MSTSGFNPRFKLWYELLLDNERECLDRAAEGIHPKISKLGEKGSREIVLALIKFFNEHEITEEELAGYLASDGRGSWSPKKPPSGY